MIDDQLSRDGFWENNVLMKAASHIILLLLFKDLDYLASLQSIHKCQEHSARMTPFTCKCLVVAEKWEVPKCIVVWQAGFLNTSLKAEMYTSALDTAKHTASILFCFFRKKHKKKGIMDHEHDGVGPIYRESTGWVWPNDSGLNEVCPLYMIPGVLWENN